MMAHDPEAARLAQAAFAALGRRDYAAAQGLARQLLLRNPQDANANQTLGVVALEAGDAATARRFLERADAAAPNQAVILNLLGVAARRCEDLDAARLAFTRAGELGLVDGWRNLGAVEAQRLDVDASIAAYQRVLRAAESDAAAHAGLAQAYEIRHDLDAAKRHAERALSLDSTNEKARLALGQVLLREKAFAAAESTAAPTAQSGASAVNRALAWGIVGEARDKDGDAHAAFEAFSAANRILLELHAPLLTATVSPYHPEGVRRMTEAAQRADVGAWGAHGALEGPAPAFLVGFPRSGTTLLDQILSSHSRIVCIEEREHFAAAASAIVLNPARLANLAELGEVEINAMRAEYWRRVRAESQGSEDALIVDKLPLNIILLPVIRRIFPEAKIILALRDPRDVMLSCYQQRFGMNPAMAQFLRLDTAAAFYDGVMRLMCVCEERLALHLHHVRYEDVVRDAEAEARKLAEFLGVGFEAAMLSYRETALARDIHTPSARQVIQPLYTSSIGRWRRYADDLAPALPVLAPWVRRWGYAA